MILMGKNIYNKMMEIPAINLSAKVLFLSGIICAGFNLGGFIMGLGQSIKMNSSYEAKNYLRSLEPQDARKYVRWVIFETGMDLGTETYSLLTKN